MRVTIIYIDTESEVEAVSYTYINILYHRVCVCLCTCEHWRKVLIYSVFSEYQGKQLASNNQKETRVFSPTRREKKEKKKWKKRRKRQLKMVIDQRRREFRDGESRVHRGESKVKSPNLRLCCTEFPFILLRFFFFKVTTLRPTYILKEKKT